jgi:type III restriction enzyme
MKNKEKLLSFSNPVRFIFSHSALKEGWDNPNVFQICSLREMGSERERRQTLGVVFACVLTKRVNVFVMTALTF